MIEGASKLTGWRPRPASARPPTFMARMAVRSAADVAVTMDFIPETPPAPAGARDVGPREGERLPSELREAENSPRDHSSQQCQAALDGRHDDSLPFGGRTGCDRWGELSDGRGANREGAGDSRGEVERVGRHLQGGGTGDSCRGSRFDDHRRGCGHGDHDIVEIVVVPKSGEPQGVGRIGVGEWRDPDEQACKDDYEHTPPELLHVAT